MAISFEKATKEIIRAGKRLDSLNLAPATSGNYSMRIDDGDNMALTVSGTHKGQLAQEQIMRADLDGNALEDKTPSAETLLHSVLYKLYPDINAVLHTHSAACTVLTMIMKNEDALVLSGYEMLKAFPSIHTHDAIVRLPIFENTQDMNDLSTRVHDYLSSAPKTPAYLIRGHGLYGWGKDMAEAERVVEALENLLSCELHMIQINCNN